MKNNSRTILITLFSVAMLLPSLSADKAEELMSIIEVDKQMVGGFDAMLPMIDQLSVQLSLNAEEKEELRGIYRNWFMEDIDRAKLSKQIADLYRQNFSDEEIQDLLNFYTSPTGQKLIKHMPTLTQKQAELGMTEAQSKQHLLMEKLNPFIQRHSPPQSGFAKIKQRSQEKTILNNLRRIASAADQYFLENGVTDVELDQLVGPNSYIRELKPIDGEDYSTLDLSANVDEWKIVSDSGLTITFKR